MFKYLKKISYFTFIIVTMIIGCSDVLADMPAIVGCGHVGEGTNDARPYMFYTVLTRHDKNNGIAVYPFICKFENNAYTDCIEIIQGDNGRFGFGENNDITYNILWDNQPEIALAKCPTNCELTGPGGIFGAGNYQCWGEKNNEFVYYFKNSFLIYVSDNGKKIYEYSYGKMSGVLNYFINEDRQTTDVSYQQKWAKIFSPDSQWFSSTRMAEQITNDDGQYQNGTGKGKKIIANDKINQTDVETIKLDDSIKNEHSTFKAQYTPKIEQCNKYIDGRETMNTEIVTQLLPELHNGVHIIRRLYLISQESVSLEILLVNQLIRNGAQSQGYDSETQNYIAENITDETKNIIAQYILDLSPNFSLTISPTTKEAIKDEIITYKNDFITCLQYIKQREDIIVNLSDEYKLMLLSDLETLHSFGEIVSPVATCSDLISEEMKQVINKYLNIFRIIVPILVIVLSIIDFGKSILESKEEDMKKAQSRLISRLIIAVVIFLIPTLITFLLTIANNIWEYINADTCGII